MSTIPSSQGKPLYLLSDAAVFRQLLINVTVLAFLAVLAASIPPLRHALVELYFSVNDWMMATAHSYAWWSLLVLLSSSCCALQLILNAFSLGCAGFNTFLGPLRPTLLAGTLALQIASWYVAWARPWQWKPTAIASVMAITMSCLPELLALYNHLRQGNVVPSTNQQQGDDAIVLRFRMDSVGCAACLTTVSGVLRQIDAIANYDANMDTGILTVYANGTEESGQVLSNEILDKLDQVGFPMTALSSFKK